MPAAKGSAHTPLGPKLFEGPYSSRCFTEVNTCSKCFAKIIASSCSLNRLHQEMLQPGMPQTSSRTYCLPWDVFQQWWDMLQLKKTHAYTFTAGGIDFSEIFLFAGKAEGWLVDWLSDYNATILQAETFQ